MTFFLYSFLFIFSTLYGNDIKEALLTPTSFESVHVVTGHYVETETDLEGIGPFGVAVKRTFAEGRWHFNLPNVWNGEEAGPQEMTQGDITLQFKYDKEKWLSQVRVVSASGRVWQTLQFHAPKKGTTQARIESSDGRQVEYQLEQVKGKWRIRAVGSTQYMYQGEQIMQRQGALGTLDVVYEKNGKVRELKQNGEITTRLTYQDGVTEITDQKQRKTTFTYNKLQQITSIEKQGIQERFAWRGLDLASRWLEDEKGKIENCQTFEHENGKLIQSTLWGNLTGRSTALTIDQKGRPHGGESYSRFYHYDAQGRISEEREQNGTLIAHIYSPNRTHRTAKITETFDKLTFRTLYTFDADGFLVKQVETDDNTWLVTTFSDFNGRGLPQQVEEKAGKNEILLKTARLEYDAAGHLVARHVFDSTGTLRQMKQKGEAEAIEIPETESVTCVYDHFDRVIEETYPTVLNGEGEPYRPTVKTAYDSVGRPSAVTDGNGFTISTIYNVRGSPIRIDYPDGTFEAFAYGLNGVLTSHTDRKGFTTWTESDGRGRPLRVVSPLGETTTRYQGFHAIESTDLQGQTTTIKYDFAGRPEKVRKGAREVDLQYDAFGEVIGRSEGDFHVRFERNAEGNILRVSFDQLDPIERMPPQVRITKETVVNDLGQIVDCEKKIDPSGLQQTLVYDAMGRVVTRDMFNPYGQKVHTEEHRYDACGRLVFLQQDGKINKWTYSSTGQCLAWIEGERTTLYHYDAFGYLVQLVKPDGNRIDYTYDTLGRMATQRSANGDVAYTFTYTENGDLLEVQDEYHQQATCFAYVSPGIVGQDRLQNGLTVVHQRNERGEPLALSLPDGSSIHYRYEGIFLVKIVRKDSEGQTLYSYTVLERDGKGRIQRARLIGDAGEIAFERDEEGHLQKIHTSIWNFEGTYQGDRLQEARLQDPEGAYTLSYDYNYRGELDQKRPTLLLEEDRNGNRIRDCIEGVETRYTYDTLNRLVTLQTEGEAPIHYTYDAFGRRMSVTTGGHTYRYFYAGQQEIGQVDEEGRIVALRVPGESFAKEVAIELEGIAYAPIHDWRGSITALISVKGGEASGWSRFDAFGARHNQGTVSPWGFMSHQHEPGTSLVFFGARFYDIASQQWLTPDPLGLVDGADRLKFVQNDPVNLVDEEGFFSMWAFAQKGWDWIGKAYNATCGFTEYLEAYSIENYYGKEIEEFALNTFGKTQLSLFGYYNTEAVYGNFGIGELNDRVRLTMINGILTHRHELVEMLHDVSDAHGGVNIHYIYRSTRGWFVDIATSINAKMGFQSEESYLLAGTWRKMIKEMGGVKGGGVVVHYAHSIGAVETRNALKLMTTEERKMIRVYTFASPTLIPQDEWGNIENYVSSRDAVCFFDPVGYIEGLLGKRKNVHFLLGSGIPGIDHLFGQKTYSTMWQELGQQFFEEFGNVVELQEAM